jgi:hypothetical protein
VKFFSAFLFLFASNAWATHTSPINPGTYGPNALPVWPGESPLILDKIDAQIGAAAQVGLFGDSAFTPLLHLDVPFGRYAQAFIDTQPVEWWWSSARSRAAYGSSEVSGATKGDLRFGGKFLIVDGESEKPSFALRLFTKTTTGKDTINRRFIDAPAYLIDGLFGMPIALPRDFAIEVTASAGFFAWQQGDAGQNDAVQFAAGATLKRYRWEISAEARGYFGWQTNDKPIVASLRGAIPFNAWLRLLAAVNLGFADAPPLDARLSFEFRLPWSLPIPAR